jgi:hypothetical protein
MSHPVWSGPSDSELRPLEVIRAHWARKSVRILGLARTVNPHENKIGLGDDCEVYSCRCLRCVRSWTRVILYWMNWQITLLGASALIVALMSLYVPMVYIRKTNKVIALLEQIAGNARK